MNELKFFAKHSRINLIQVPSAIRGVMENSVTYTKCCKWMHARSAKIKRVTVALAKDFVCWQCIKTIKKQIKKYHFLIRSSL